MAGADVPGELVGVIEKGTPIVGAISGGWVFLRAARQRRRRRELVQDEILGHDEGPGVPYKPSLAVRQTNLEQIVNQHAQADVMALQAIHATLSALAASVGHPEAVRRLELPPGYGQ